MKSQLKQKIKMALIQLADLNNQYHHYSELSNYEVMARIQNRINQIAQQIKILEDEYNKPDKSYLKAKIEIKRTLLQSASLNDKRKLAKEIEALEAEYQQLEDKPSQIFKPSEKLSAAEYRSQE